MSKIIIHNCSSNADSDILPLISCIIGTGRISNDGKQYCYVTVFRQEGIIVYTKLNKSSDTFYVEDYK